jgi:hypothetical protein
VTFVGNAQVGCSMLCEQALCSQMQKVDVQRARFDLDGVEPRRWGGFLGPPQLRLPLAQLAT